MARFGEDDAGEIGPIVCLYSRAIPLHTWYVVSLLNARRSISCRLFRTRSQRAVISPFTTPAVTGRNTMCNISERAYAYRSRIAGCVKCDYSTRREIVAVVLVPPSHSTSNRSDPPLFLSISVLSPSLLLHAFSRRRTWNRGLSRRENLLNSGSFILKIGGQWRVNSRGNMRTLRDSSHNQSVGYSGWEVWERADHLMFILKCSVWRM